MLVTALFVSNGLIRLQIKSGFFQRISLDFSSNSQSKRREAHPEHMVCSSELNYPDRRMDGEPCLAGLWRLQQLWCLLCLRYLSWEWQMHGGDVLCSGISLGGRKPTPSLALVCCRGTSGVAWGGSAGWDQQKQHLGSFKTGKNFRREWAEFQLGANH